MKTIVLAIDFEWQSTKILAVAKKYALAFKAHLHLVHVSTLVTKPINYDPIEESAAWLYHAGITKKHLRRGASKN
mgnify:CR=1 FL=1